jgi:iron(III) transport system substrate-binding protein
MENAMYRGSLMLSALFSLWSTTAQAQPADWAKVVEDAKKEGEVVVWGAAGESQRRFWKDSFEKDNPGIKVTLFQPATTADRDARVQRELEAGILKTDVLVAGGAGMVSRLKPAKALQPLKPFMRADILDGKNWVGGEAAWVDLDKQFVLIADLPAGRPGITNESIPEGAIKTWDDLLDPKYDGKIISLDPRSSGMAFAFGLFMNQSPELGPDYVKRFFKGGRVVFTQDQRQISEWVDSGRMLIGFAVRENEIADLLNVGSKIRVLPPLTAKGLAQSITTGTDSSTSIPNIPALPHPNAAKVYVNWMFSKQGQQAMVDVVKVFSVRTDVDQSALNARVKQIPGVRYTNANVEGFSSPENAKAMRDNVAAAMQMK